MMQAIRNPVRFLPCPLLPAEQKFARCLANGEPCSFLQDPNAPIVPKAGTPENTIRSEVIRFFAYGGDKESGGHLVRGESIIVQGAWICREHHLDLTPLDLTHANIPYALGFFACHFAVAVKMRFAECPALYLNGSHLAHGLAADGLTTKGAVQLNDGFKSKCEVALSRARIGGDLNCTNGEFCNPSGRAIIANQATVKGAVFLHDGFSAAGEVRMVNARIGGDLDCQGGSFANPGKSALSADGVTVGGNIQLNGRFCAAGAVKIPGAKISGDLDCVGGKFRNLNGRVALSAHGMTAGGNVFLCENFLAEGLVNILGANIGGNLDCASGCFYNPGKYALNAERVITGGHVFLNKHVSSGYRPFSARGRVRFANADIGRNFNCKGGQFFHSGEGAAIAAGGLRSRGAVFLSEGFATQGDVDLHVARIGNFVCKECGPTSKGVINLASTKAVAVDDDKGAWDLFEFILDDFTYDTFYVDSPRDKEGRQKWLAKRPKEMPSRKGGKKVKVPLPFSPLPYEQVAKVLFAMGHDDDAREILLAKEQEVTKRKKWWQKPLRWLWEKLAGYGYKPARTCVAGMIVIAIGGGVFWCADESGRMVPHQPVVLAKEEYQTARKAGAHPAEAVRLAVPGYPGFNPLLFSADIFVPLFNLHQEPFWVPDSGKGDFFAWVSRRFQGEVRSWDKKFDWWWLLTLWYWLEISFGWILTSLFLLSVTGVLRPRQSSGEKG